jgi:hypothetical protein
LSANKIGARTNLHQLAQGRRLAVRVNWECDPNSIRLLRSSARVESAILHAAALGWVASGSSAPRVARYIPVAAYWQYALVLAHAVRATELGPIAMPSRRQRNSQRDEIWRAELNRLGTWAVHKKLGQAGVGHGGSVHGFVSGAIERKFIEEWLGAREEAEARQQRATLRWARTAGLLAMLGVLIGIANYCWRLKADTRCTRSQLPLGLGRAIRRFSVIGALVRDRSKARFCDARHIVARTAAIA